MKNGLNDTEKDAEPPRTITRRLELLGFIPLPIFMVLIASLHFLNTTTVFEPPLLLPILNTLFGASAALLVALGAARLYLRGGAIAQLLLGCGNLSFGLGYLFAGWFIDLESGPNAAVTMHDSGALLGALFHTGGILLIYTGAPPEIKPGRRRLIVVLLYASVAAFMTLLAIMSLGDATLTFFVQGVGATLVDQVVLGIAIMLYAATAFLFMRLHKKSQASFIYWYSVALGLIAVGLLAVFIQTSVGSPIGWAGRSAKYLGHIYFLLTIVVASTEFRRRGVSVEQGIISVLRHRLEEQNAQLAHVNDELMREIVRRAQLETQLKRQTAQLQTELVKHKRVEDEILGLKDFYSSILESIISGVWVSDKNDAIYYANKG